MQKSRATHTLECPREDKEVVQRVPPESKIRLTDERSFPVLWHRPFREAEQYDPPVAGAHNLRFSLSQTE